MGGNWGFQVFLATVVRFKRRDLGLLMDSKGIIPEYSEAG